MTKKHLKDLNSGEIGLNVVRNVRSDVGFCVGLNDIYGVRLAVGLNLRVGIKKGVIQPLVQEVTRKLTMTKLRTHANVASDTTV